MFFILTAVIVLLAVAYYLIDLLMCSLNIGKITDKYVFITGCDTGFGEQAAVQLDKLGFHVFAGCLTKDGAGSLSEICSSRLTTVILDIGSTESIEQAVDLVKEKLPAETGLWALINNAGIIGTVAPIEFCSRHDVLSVINVNLLGTIDVTRHFLPLIRKCQGRIVITSSISGRVATGPTAYVASKFALEGFSDSLRREVCHQGIKVSVVEPGVFKTSIFNTEKLVGDVQKVLEKYSPEQQAVYGGPGFINKIREVLTQLQASGSPNLDLVVDVFIHAISSRFPRTRYGVGSDAKWFFLPVSYLPDRIADYILSR